MHVGHQLSIHEASRLVGVPVAQLVRWAGFGVGPPFSGHPLTPNRMQYDADKLKEWKRDKADGTR